MSRLLLSIVLALVLACIWADFVYWLKHHEWNMMVFREIYAANKFLLPLVAVLMFPTAYDLVGAAGVLTGRTSQVDPLIKSQFLSKMVGLAAFLAAGFTVAKFI